MFNTASLCLRVCILSPSCSQTAFLLGRIMRAAVSADKAGNAMVRAQCPTTGANLSYHLSADAICKSRLPALPHGTQGASAAWAAALLQALRARKAPKGAKKNKRTQKSRDAGWWMGKLPSFGV